MTRPTAVVLRAIGLGDFVTGLPAFRLLRDTLPDHHVTAVVPAPFAGELLATGTVDAVLPRAGLAPDLDLPPRPDVAVDLHGNGPASRDPLLAAGPGRLVAFEHGGIRWDPAEHEVTRWCRLVREGFATTAPDPPVRGVLPTHPAPARYGPGATVVHPGAAFPSRRWPVQRFAQVAAGLTGRGHRVVVTGTPGEAELVGAVVAAAPGAVAATDLTVAELFGLVAHARLVVSGDTGTAHVASAYGTPSVVLFGPVAPSRWGPPASPRHRVLWPVLPTDPPGDPHGTTLDPVLARTAVADVLAAVETLERSEIAS